MELQRGGGGGGEDSSIPESNTLMSELGALYLAENDEGDDPTREKPVEALGDLEPLPEPPPLVEIDSIALDTFSYAPVEARAAFGLASPPKPRPTWSSWWRVRRLGARRDTFSAVPLRLGCMETLKQLRAIVFLLSLIALMILSIPLVDFLDADCDRTVCGPLQGGTNFVYALLGHTALLVSLYPLLWVVLAGPSWVRRRYALAPLQMQGGRRKNVQQAQSMREAKQASAAEREARMLLRRLAIARAQARLASIRAAVTVGKGSSREHLPLPVERPREVGGGLGLSRRRGTDGRIGSRAESRYAVPPRSASGILQSSGAQNPSRIVGYGVGRSRSWTSPASAVAASDRRGKKVAVEDSLAYALPPMPAVAPRQRFELEADGGDEDIPLGIMRSYSVADSSGLAAAKTIQRKRSSSGLSRQKTEPSPLSFGARALAMVSMRAGGTTARTVHEAQQLSASLSAHLLVLVTAVATGAEQLAGQVSSERLLGAWQLSRILRTIAWSCLWINVTAYIHRDLPCEREVAGAAFGCANPWDVSAVPSWHYETESVFVWMLTLEFCVELVRAQDKLAYLRSFEAIVDLLSLPVLQLAIFVVAFEDIGRE